MTLVAVTCRGCKKERIEVSLGELRSEADWACKCTKCYDDMVSSKQIDAKAEKMRALARKCDCGGFATGLPCYSWCSLKEK